MDPDLAKCFVPRNAFCSFSLTLHLILLFVFVDVFSKVHCCESGIRMVAHGSGSQ